MRLNSHEKLKQNQLDMYLPIGTYEKISLPVTVLMRKRTNCYSDTVFLLLRMTFREKISLYTFKFGTMTKCLRIFIHFLAISAGQKMQ